MVAVFLLSVGSTGLYASSENLNLRFRFGKSETDVSALETLFAGEKTSQVKSVVIKASSSPDGPYWVNKTLAEKRATYIYNWVREICPDLDSTLIRVETVAEDWSGVAAWLRRCNKPYKEEALKIVTAGDKIEREEKLQDLWAGEAWDDLMHSAFPALRCVKVSVEYASPEVSLEVSAEETAQIAAPDSNSVRILFPAGIRYVRPEYAGNSVQLQILRWIVENLGIPAEKINVVSCGEDWDGLLREVRENYHGNNRDVVLKILGDTSLSNASKKAAIRSLDGNASWKSLVDGHMSGLRSVRITVE